MKKLDFGTFIQILILIVTSFMAIQNFFLKEEVNPVEIIFFWTFVFLIIIYAFITTADLKFIQRIKKVDNLEGELKKVKELLDYRKMTEDLNMRLKIIESKMNKKGVLSPQTVILIIIVILLIIYILRQIKYG